MARATRRFTPVEALPLSKCRTIAVSNAFSAEPIAWRMFGKRRGWSLCAAKPGHSRAIAAPSAGMMGVAAAALFEADAHSLHSQPFAHKVERHDDIRKLTDRAPCLAQKLSHADSLRQGQSLGGDLAPQPHETGLAPKKLILNGERGDHLVAAQS
ncbi:MAG TPA: hypothetical protein VEF36_12645, partial [Roseiarcus sp.]|nr:hypothetical protein [Roseiarcus sp.]